MTLSLFDDPPHNGTPTSREAAEQIKPSAGTLRAKVLDAIKAAKWMGATDEQIQDALGMEGSTERPRRQELQKRGLVHDSGTTRATKSNRQAVVWVATEYLNRSGAA